MKRIIAFAGSNSKTSINKKLVSFAGSLIEQANVELLDLNDFDVPTYSVDLEQEAGIPSNAEQLLEKIKTFLFNYIIYSIGIFFVIFSTSSSFTKNYKLISVIFCSQSMNFKWWSFNNISLF